MQAFHVTKCVGMQKSKKTLGGLNEKVFGDMVDCQWDTVRYDLEYVKQPQCIDILIKFYN